MTISISINNESLCVGDNVTLAALLAARENRQPGPCAVALNGDFVPRSQYAEVTLKHGDEVDIVSPVGGG